MTKPVNEDWVRIQEKTFRNWANYWLKQNGHEPIDSLSEGLVDGIKLIKLVSCLTGKELTRYKDPARLRVQRINNINIALSELTTQGVKLTTSAEQITDGEIKFILGLMWMMIQKFQIQAGSTEGGGKGKSAKDAMMEWLREYLDGYPVEFTGFPKNTADGKIFAYLVHRKDPSLIDLNSINSKPPRQLLVEAFAAAEKLGVPQLLDPDDVLARPDEQSILTYISTFRSKVNEPLATVVAEVGALKTILAESIAKQEAQKEGILNSQLQDMKSQLADHQAKMEQQQTERLRELQEAVKDSQREKRELEASQLEMKRELEGLRVKMEQALKDKERDSQKIEKLEKDKDQLKDDLNEEKKRKLMGGAAEQMLQAELEEIREKLEKSKGKRKNEKEKHASELDDLNEKYKKAQAGDLDKIALGVELAALKRKNDDLEKDMKKKDDKLGQLQAEIDKKEKEKQAIEDSHKGNASKDLEANLARARLQAELDDLKRKTEKKLNKYDQKKAENKKLEAEVEELKKRNEQNAKLGNLHGDERKRLEDQLEELRKKLDKEQKEKQELEDQNANLLAETAKLNYLPKKMEQLQKKLDEEKAKKDKFKGENEKELKKLKEQLDEKERDALKAEQEKKALERQLEELRNRAERDEPAPIGGKDWEAEIRELKKKLEAERKAKEAAIEGEALAKLENERMMRELEELRKEKEKARKKKDEAEEEVKALKKENENLKSKPDYEQKFFALKKDMDQLSNKPDTAEEVEKLKAQIKKDREQSKREKDDYETEKSDLKEELEKLKIQQATDADANAKELERLKNQLKNANDEKSHLKNELATVRGASSAEAANDEMMRHLREENEKLKKGRLIELAPEFDVIDLVAYEFNPANYGAPSAAEIKAQELEEQLASMKEQFERKKSIERANIDVVAAEPYELAQLKDDITDLTNENEKLNQEIEQLRDENEKLNDENGKLNDENNKLRDENEKLNDEHEKLSDKNTQLEDAIVELEEELEALRANGAGGGKKTKLQKDLEVLVRELYYRKGAATQFRQLKETHESEKYIEDTILELKDRLKFVLAGYRENLKDENDVARQEEQILEDTIENIRAWRSELTALQNTWVSEYNGLGDQYEPKTRLEADLDQWRKKLVKIADSYKTYQKEEENVESYLKDVEELLDKDDDSKETIDTSKTKRISARKEVEEEIDRIHRFLEEQSNEEILRLRAIIEKDQHLDESPDKDGSESDIASVVELMIENYKELFSGLTTKPQINEVHQLVHQSVRYLRKNALEVHEILNKNEYKPYAVNQIKSYAYRGYGVDLSKVRDPLVVACLLKDYFKELREPLMTYKLYGEFVNIGGLPEGKTTLKKLKDTLKELPTMRRATLAVLISFLADVAAHQDDNKLNPSRLAEIFGPLLLRPSPAKSRHHRS